MGGACWGHVAPQNFVILIIYAVVPLNIEVVEPLIKHYDLNYETYMQYPFRQLGEVSFEQTGDVVGSNVQPVAPFLAATKQQGGDIRHSNDSPPCDPPIRHLNAMERHVPVFVRPG